jgi:hypothetical protein
LILLTTFGGYPVSMLGVDDSVRTNNMPPSLALVALGVMQIGLLLSVRHPVERWLQQPRRWALVVAGGSVAMTLYLWHMSAMVAGIGIVFGLGLVPDTAFDTRWWVTRPLWVAFLTVLLVPLVLIFRRYEKPAPTEPIATRPGSIALTVAGVAGVCAGLALLIIRGLHVPGQPLGIPVAAVVAVVGGLAALGVIKREASPAGLGHKAAGGSDSSSDR